MAQLFIISKKYRVSTFTASLSYMRVRLLLTVSHKFCVVVMNIPCMTRSTYLQKELQIEKDIETALDINLKAVAEEEIKHSQTDHTVIPQGKCYADCARCKRSYKTKYNALSGAASIIGHYTKNVLYIGVANKKERNCRATRTQMQPQLRGTFYGN